MMKNQYSLCGTAFLFLCFLPVLAPGQARLGLKAGAGFSTLARAATDFFRLEEDRRYKIFPVAGLALSWDWSEALALKADLLYTERGDKIVTEAAGLESVQLRRLDYLLLPVFLNARLAGGLRLEAGLEPAFLLAGRLQIDDADPVDLEDVAMPFDSFNLGAGAGLGYRFASGLELNGRYTFSLSPAGEVSLLGLEFVDYYNHSFYLTLFYPF